MVVLLVLLNSIQRRHTNVGYCWKVLKEGNSSQSGIVEQYLKKVYHGTYIYNGVVDHYLKKVMLVILVLLSMMAGGHQQSCLRSLIRHRPHKYWHRFGLTHTYTLCKSETHIKALCTCGGRQPKRESISLQTVHISLLYFFTAIIHCIVPYTPIYEPGQISNCKYFQ